MLVSGEFKIWTTHYWRFPMNWAALRWLTKPGADLASWLVAAVFFYLAARQIGLTIKPLEVGGAWVDLKKEVVYGLFGLFLLLPAVFGRPRTGVVRRLLASRPLSYGS